MLHAFLVDAAGQLFKSLFVAIRSVLCHEKTAESDVKLSIVAIKLLLSDKCVFSACLASVTSLLKKVPVCADQELLSFLQLGATHADVGLCKDEVSWQQLNRLLSETHSLLDQVVQCVVDNFVGILVLVHDKELLCPFNCHIDFLTLTVESKKY